VNISLGNAVRLKLIHILLARNGKFKFGNTSADVTYPSSVC